MDDAGRHDLTIALATELETARLLMEDLAVQLCLDPVVFERHAEGLQRFDQLAQVIGEVAGVLRRGGSPHEAIGVVRLDAMRDRLLDNIGHGGKHHERTSAAG